MKKRLYSLVVPLILVACSQKVELGSTGMYPNYQVGEMVSLIPVDSLTYGDVIAYYSYIPGFQERAFKRIVGLPGDTSVFRISNVSLTARSANGNLYESFSMKMMNVKSIVNVCPTA